MFIPIESDNSVNNIKDDILFSARPKLVSLCRSEGMSGAIPRLLHNHTDRAEIVFIVRGCGNYVIDDEFYSVKAGDLLVFNQRSTHDERPLPSNDLLMYSCGFGHLKMNGLPANHIIANTLVPVIHAEEYSEQIKNIFESIFFQISNNKHLREDIISSLICNLLLLISSLFFNREDNYHSKTVLGQRIKEYLDKHYLTGIDVTTVSQVLNINRYYLSHVFKAFSGFSPKQYIIRRRIGEAQSLLFNTDYSISKIAYHVGYQNVSNFNYIFEKVVGISPSKYKKIWLADEQVEEFDLSSLENMS